MVLNISISCPKIKINCTLSCYYVLSLSYKWCSSKQLQYDKRVKGLGTVVCKLLRVLKSRCLLYYPQLTEYFYILVLHFIKNY